MSLAKRAKQEEHREQQPRISLSLCHTFTSNFRGFIHSNSAEGYAVGCSCATPNVPCGGEMKIKNLAPRPPGPLRDPPGSAGIGRVLRSNTFFLSYLGCQCHLPCGKTVRLMNANQKRPEIVLLPRFARRTE